MSEYTDGEVPGVGGQRSVPSRWGFFAAIILSLATLLSAWTGYEASRWGSEYSKQGNAATVARIEAVNAAELANRQLTIDVLLFSDWLQAEAEGNAQVADVVRVHFRPEFLPVFDQWLATSKDGEIPVGTPFDLDYRLAAEVEADRLREDAAQASLRADRARETSDNYVGAAVLYASVLFLAGISSKISGARAQRLTVVLSGVAFVFAVFFTFRLPLIV